MCIQFDLIAFNEPEKNCLPIPIEPKIFLLYLSLFLQLTFVIPRLHFLIIVLLKKKYIMVHME